MADQPRSIFRTNAVQTYLQGREETVLPRFVSPRTFLFLWVLLFLHVLAAFVACLTEVPVYAEGSAVVVSGSKNGGPLREDVGVVALLSAEDREELRVGQRMFLQEKIAGERLVRSVAAVEPAVISPAVARKRFALPPEAEKTLNQPCTVAWAAFPPAPEGLPASAHLGAVYDAQIEVGTRRVLSFLPWVDGGVKD
jgi:hypothetical protein